MLTAALCRYPMRINFARTLPLLSLVACATSQPSSGNGADAAISADGAASADASWTIYDSLPVQPPPVIMYAHTADTLYKLNDETFELTLVGKFGLDEEDTANDLAITPSGDIYINTQTDLYLVDKNTGKATQTAPLASDRNVGMTFLPGGQLLAGDKNGGLRSIDPQTGVVTERGTFTQGYALAGDLVAVGDGTMFAIADKGPNGDEASNNVLLTIDPQNGSVENVIGPIGFSQVWGSAFANGHVYAFTRDGELIEIDRITGHGTLVKTFPDIFFYGAGVTPLVSID